jgi:hypothetical protein
VNRVNFSKGLARERDTTDPPPTARSGARRLRRDRDAQPADSDLAASSGRDANFDRRRRSGRPSLSSPRFHRSRYRLYQPRSLQALNLLEFFGPVRVQSSVM